MQLFFNSSSSLDLAARLSPATFCYLPFAREKKGELKEAVRVVLEAVVDISITIYMRVCNVYICCYI